MLLSSGRVCRTWLPTSHYVVMDGYRPPSKGSIGPLISDTRGGENSPECCHEMHAPVATPPVAGSQTCRLTGGPRRVAARTENKTPTLNKARFGRRAG